MKNRKFTLALVLLLVVAMLTGCGGDKPSAGSNDPAVTQAPATEPVPDNALALGVVEGNTYTNTYAGLGCSLDSGWVIYPAEELQELPTIVQEMVEGTELEDAMADVTQFTDMYAENLDLLTNVNVLFQKQEMKERIAYAMMGEKEVLEGILSQQDLMVEAYAQGGIQVESMELVTVTFLGEEHYAIKTVAETEGVPYYFLQMFNFWEGEYSVTITLASFIEDNTAQLLDLFYPVD